MATYEYHCRACGETFTRAEHISEHGTTRTRCPRCQSENVEQVFSPVFAKTSKKS